MTRIDILIIGLILSLWACNSDSKIKVPNEIEDALYEKYRDVDISSLEWDIIDNFFVAEYRKDRYHCKSWFSSNGNWLMTETMDLIFDKDIPNLIVEDFKKTGSTKNDVLEGYKVDFPDVASRYVLETRTSFFFYRDNGDFLKKVDGAWKNRPIVIESEVLNYIKNSHVDTLTTILDADMKSSPLHVTIFEGRSKTIYFNSPTQWLATFWEVPPSEIPDNVRKTLIELSGDRNPVKRYYVEYHVPQTFNLQSRNTLGDEKNKKNAYVFKFNDEKNAIYIDEIGEEVKGSGIIPL